MILNISIAVLIIFSISYIFFIKRYIKVISIFPFVVKVSYMPTAIKYIMKTQPKSWLAHVRFGPLFFNKYTLLTRSGHLPETVIHAKSELIRFISRSDVIHDISTTIETWVHECCKKGEISDSSIMSLARDISIRLFELPDDVKNIPIFSYNCILEHLQYDVDRYTKNPKDIGASSKTLQKYFIEVYNRVSEKDRFYSICLSLAEGNKDDVLAEMGMLIGAYYVVMPNILWNLVDRILNNGPQHSVPDNVSLTLVPRDINFITVWLSTRVLYRSDAWVNRFGFGPRSCPASKFIPNLSKQVYSILKQFLFSDDWKRKTIGPSVDSKIHTKGFLVFKDRIMYERK